MSRQWWGATFGLAALAGIAMAIAPSLRSSQPRATPEVQRDEVLQDEGQRDEAQPEVVLEAVIETPPPTPERLLLDPSRVDGARAPDVFDVRFDTTEGVFLARVHRDWAPIGADRFYGLVRAGFYDQTSFFRAIEGFMVQWGIHPDPAVAAAWKEARLDDDPVEASNTRGRITFATAGPNTRTTQLYVNLVDNSRLDTMGFAPFAEVIEGMDVVERLYTGYGEGAPMGRGPEQQRLQREGDAYLAAFPELDRIVRATVIQMR